MTDEERKGEKERERARKSCLLCDVRETCGANATEACGQREVRQVQLKVRL